MGYTYTQVDGQRVQVAVAAAFSRLAAAFESQFGLTLHIESGTRTRDEQAELYRAYLGGWGNLALPPGQSNHEEDGPIGPRALDVHDSGDDPGVTRAGTERAQWLRGNAAAYGFDPAGYGFSQVEPWHIEYTGALDDGVQTGQNLTSRPTADVQRLVGADPDGVYGADTTAKVAAWQAAHGLEADGVWGPLSDAAGFPPADTALAVDGDWGPATTRAFQRALGVTIDGELGPQTWSAFQAAAGITVDGIPGPQTYKALQATVGATIDGELGPETTRKLQEYLNAGRGFAPVTLPPEPAPASYPQPSAPTYPGATWWGHSPNSTPRGGQKVEFFVVHHAASTASIATLRDRFMAPNDREVSPSWLVGADGSVSEIVPPDDYRPWTSGQFDFRAVTVETQNTSGDPTWGISDASHEAIARIVAWAADRYGFPIDRTHVIGHREVPGAATACPGPSMDLDRIVRLAQQIAAPVTPEIPTPPEPPAPTPEETPMPQPTSTPITDEQLATLLATAAKAAIEAPSEPAIPDRIAKPLWIALSLAAVSIPPLTGLTVVDWAHWDVTIATQASGLLVGWVGSVAAVLGLSRYGKTKS